MAALQASGGLPWIGALKSSACKLFQLGGPEKLAGADDSRHVLQTNGGLADFWYMDDGDILCHPIFVPTYLERAFECDVPRPIVCRGHVRLPRVVIVCRVQTVSSRGSRASENTAVVTVSLFVDVPHETAAVPAVCRGMYSHHLGQ